MSFYLSFLTLISGVWLSMAAVHIYGNDDSASAAASSTSRPTLASKSIFEFISSESVAESLAAAPPISQPALAVDRPVAESDSTISANNQRLVSSSTTTPVATSESAVASASSANTSESSQTSSIQLVQKNDLVAATGQGLSGFGYFTASSKPVCSDDHQGQVFVAAQTATSLKHRQWVCFRAQNLGQTYIYELLQVDLTAPTISITQFKDSISVKTQLSGLGEVSVLESSWQKIKTSTETEPVCQAADFSNSKLVSNGKQITVSQADNNKWLCYRVSSSVSVYGYGKYQLDYNAPTIEISKSTNGQTLTASSKATDLPANPAWRKSSSSCNTATSFTTGNVISNLAPNKYYCFSVSDKAGNEGFAEFFNHQQQTSSYKPATPAPRSSQSTFRSAAQSAAQSSSSLELWLIQDNDVIKIDKSKSRNIAGAVIKYFTAISYTDCSADNIMVVYTTYDAVNNNGVGGLGNNQWVCFKASKNSQVVFVNFQIDLTTPSFTLSQDHTTVTMSTTANLSDIGYFQASSEPPATGLTSCSNDKTTGWTADSDGSITGIEDSKWICFRAKNTIGVYGYAKLKVNLSQPSFTLTQDNTTVTMSTTANLTDIGYFETNSEPPATGSTSCSDDKTTGWTADADGTIADMLKITSGFALEPRIA